MGRKLTPHPFACRAHLFAWVVWSMSLCRISQVREVTCTMQLLEMRTMRDRRNNSHLGSLFRFTGGCFVCPASSIPHRPSTFNNALGVVNAVGNAELAAAGFAFPL